jgi:glycosyltransferase involved in cell wall biosynthesis
MLYFSNALDHPLTSRMHFFIQFLKKNNIHAKVFDVSFYYKNQSLINFIKEFFNFPSKISNLQSGNVEIPSLPNIGKKLSRIRPFLNLLYTFDAFLLTKLASKLYDYNVIISADPVSALISNFARKDEVYNVYEDIDYFEDIKTGKLLRFIISFLEKLAIKRANLVVSVSEPLLKRAQNYNKNCILVPNGANLENYTNPNNTKRDSKLVYAGTIDDWAGLKIIIESIPQIIKKFPKLKLVIIGDGKEKESLVNLVNNLSVKDYVTFLGRLPYEKMAELLCTMKIGLAMFKPTNAGKYASPLKLFDYMGAGLPIIATNIGDIGRILNESEAGFPINWRKDEFVHSVYTIMKDEKIWHSFHKNGLDYVRNFDWDVLFSGLLHEIEKRLEKIN